MIYLIALLTVVTSWWLPWWFVAIWCGLLGILAPSYKKAFIVSFLAVFLSWILVAYYFDLKAQMILSHKMTDVFFMPHPLVLYILTGTVGGLMAGLSAGCGYLLMQIRQAGLKSF